MLKARVVTSTIGNLYLVTVTRLDATGHEKRLDTFQFPISS